MQKLKKFALLQIFAEDGGEMSTNATEGDIESAGSDVSEDTQDSQLANDTQTEESKTSFDDLINGDYKEDYQKSLEKNLGKRMKSSNKRIKEYEDRLSKVAPVLEKLAYKHNIADPTDYDAIIEAVDNDNSYYENYAIEHNVSNEQARTLIEAERITRQNQEQAEFDEKYSNWMNQATQLQQKYPGFDFAQESENDDFRRLLKSGLTVEDAYTVIHRDEIIGGAMQYTYQQSQKEFADTQRARANRPIENGTSGQQASSVTIDINNLSPEQEAKIDDAIRRGDRVTLDNFQQYL